MASIERYETAGGATRWRVRYRTPDRRQTDKRGFKTKRDAEAFAAQLEVDKRRGAYVAPSAGRVKLGEYAQAWLDGKHDLKPSTRDRYQRVLDVHFAPKRDVALGDISREWVRGWVADLSGRMAATTVHKVVGTLRQVLEQAVEDNRLVANPCDGVSLPSTTTVEEQRFLTLEQLHRLAAAAGDYKALVYVLGTCGLRFGEAAELRWRDVDLDKLTIRVARSVVLVDGVFEVGPPKNGKPRTVGLPRFVADMLDQGDADDDDLVFPDGNGNYLRANNARRRWWARAVEAAGLFPEVVAAADGTEVTVYSFKLHELRHTAASLAIQAGAHIKSLQNMLGHASASLTLDRYGHLYGSDVEAVGIAINQLLTRECGQNVGTGPVGGLPESS